MGVIQYIGESCMYYLHKWTRGIPGIKHVDWAFKGPMMLKQNYKSPDAWKATGALAAGVVGASVATYGVTQGVKYAGSKIGLCKGEQKAETKESAERTVDNSSLTGPGMPGAGLKPPADPQQVD